MKILHAVFTSEMGGLEQAYVNCTRVFVGLGHEVIALLKPNAPYKAEVAALTPYIITENPRGFYDLFSVQRLKKKIAELKPDAIVAHNGRATTLLAKAAGNVPVIGLSHSYKTKHMPRACKLVVLTEHMRAHFAQAGFSDARMHVIPNAITLPEAKPTKPRGDKLVIGAIGRMTGEKGFADLIAALKLLKIDYVCHIAGDGPERAALQASAEGLDIVWEGWVTDKAAFYKKLDVLAVPSREDSFGLTVLEGLAHGVPVVATDAPGPASIITHETNGLLVPRQNPEALAAAINRLAGDEAFATTLAHAGRLRADDFSFDHVSTRWAKLLTNVAEKP